ncbi:MAG: hypothetical protein ACT4TC_13155 [Myxococcaceae bacterium]
MKKLWVVLLCCAACGNLKSGGEETLSAVPPPASTDSSNVPDAGSSDSGGGAPVVEEERQEPDAEMLDQTDGGPVVTGIKVESWVTGRSRLGARTTSGFPAWRRGLAVSGGDVYWVESGTSPGIYATSTAQPCQAAECVRRLGTLTRPSAFAVTASHFLVADTNVLKRVAFADGVVNTVLSHTDEITELGGNSERAFWTTTRSNIFATTLAPTPVTNTPIYSNGTPIELVVAGDTVYWVGTDISGIVGALQMMRTNGTGAAEVLRFSSEFQAAGGNATFLYYAEGNPSLIHRLTIATGRNEIVDREGFGVADFVVNATHAYWIEPGDAPGHLNGRLRRIGHDAKKPETIAEALAFPVALAVSGDTIYLATAGTSANKYADGVLLKISLP